MINTPAETYKNFKALDFYKKELELSLFPFNFMPFRDKYMIANHTGEFLFVTRDELTKLVSKDFDSNNPKDVALLQRYLVHDFVYYKNNKFTVEKNAIKYRTKKGFLFNGPTLHLFVVTIRCQHKCHYCQITPKDEKAFEYDMSPETARNGVEFMMNAPSERLTVEFQGGEPLLAFDIVKEIVLYTEELNRAKNKYITFVIATTLVDVTEEQLTFLSEHNVEISTSLDGDETLHNKNRPIRSRNTYSHFIEGLEKARKYYDAGHINPLTTLSRTSLQNIESIVKSYLDLGYHAIYLRELSPFGFAVKTFNTIGYSGEEYIEFYKKALDYIIDLNKQGIYFREGHATLLLKRILTPYATGFVDLQSPAGAAISAMAYYYNGDIYPADEARMLSEMGDDTFRLGNLATDSYDNIYSLPSVRRLIQDSIIESINECSECAYLQYCGSAPLVNYVKQGDHYGHRPTSEFCFKQKEIFAYLLNYFYENDETVINIFWSWVQGNPSLNPTIKSTERAEQC